MKYIVLKTENMIGRELPIIFPSILVHSDVAELMQTHISMTTRTKTKVVSAGEINLFGGEVLCSGKSTTLNISSRKDIDEELIKMYNYFHGVVGC